MKKVYSLITLLSISFASFAQTGITWGMGMNIAANTYGNMHPRMALDASGNPMVIWGKMADKSVYFSKWNGTSFTTPIKLNPAWMQIATASWMGPDIAAHGDTVYVVMKRVPEASDTNYSYIMSSFNGGQNFSAPVRIDNIADSMSRFPTVTTSDNGHPLVAFMKFDNTFMDARWVVSQSNDFGNSFAPDVKASGWGGSAEVCDCCPGAVVASGNKVAMLYRDNNINIRDTWMGISTNGGNTFSSGYNIDNHNWMIMSCPSTGPDGVVVGDTVYSVFMNGAPTYRNYLSKASLSAGAVSAVNGLATGTPGLSSQNFPRIASYGNAAVIAWVQTANGVYQLPLMFTQNIQAGFSGVYDTVDTDNITNTDVAISNGKIFVVWQDDGSGTVKYRAGTYNAATSVSETMDESLVSISPNPATDILNVSVPGGNYNLKIKNVNGQTLHEQFISGGPNSCRINLSKYARGTYFISVQEGAKVFSRKFVKTE